LIVDQVMKDSSYHDPKMVAYCKMVRLLEDKFDGLKLNHVTRQSNEAADEIAKLVSGWAPVPAGVFTSDLYKPSIPYQGSAHDGGKPLGPSSRANPTPIPTDPKAMQIKEDPDIGPDPLSDWRILYLDCLVRSILLIDRTEARCLMHRVKLFVLLDQDLYKRSPTGNLQRCIPS
jgi:hypothetical protein